MQSSGKHRFASQAIKGFTLTEVLIVVAIVAILSSIALPAYSTYVKRGRAADATTALLATNSELLRYGTQNQGKYTGFAKCPTNTAYFTYTCPGIGAPDTFTLKATGVAGMMDNFLFTIDQTGAQTSKFDSAVLANCWLNKKGGTC